MGVLQPQEAQRPGMFPANADDVKRFRMDIVKAIHSPEQQKQVIQALQTAGDHIGAVIGQLAGSMVMMLIHRRMAEQGVKVPSQLAVQGVSFAIKELIAMAQKMGVQIDEQQVQDAIQVAGQIVEQASQQGAPQGQPAPMQPGAIPAPGQQQGQIGAMQATGPQPIQ